ncbi:MAG: xerDC1 [Cypionkella sp.]|uniref:site-specific integrase n=1 Tax=Cypionkella sp. TaxID=2811411 RepID=UPI002602806A|nr:site-specific integrase [Cypionkella sp.]MDB5660495.1 xerDC1 [Cypionkella sp.]
MYAAAITILLSCPMRMKNLASLDIDKHLTSHGHGAGLRYSIRVDANEVKNHSHVEVQLNAKNSRLLDKYIMQWRHHISPIASTALFPNRGNGTARPSSNFGQTLTAEIYRQTGIGMNPHLFRHFAAYLYLQERPGDFETVRRFLGHKKLETTMTFYAELSNKWAHEHYDDVVLKKWGGSDGK